MFRAHSMAEAERDVPVLPNADTTAWIPMPLTPPVDALRCRTSMFRVGGAFALATRSLTTLSLATLSLATLSLATLSGCITSGPGEYGTSAEVRDLHLELCAEGLIDDAEDNNSQINTIGGRDGYWFTFKDELGSTIDPEGEFHMSPGGAEGSQFAAEMKGKMGAGGQNVFPYAGIGFNLSNPKLAYDAGKAQGIQFWAKGPGRIRFKAPDVMTDPVGEKCTACYNDFGVDIFLDDKWQRYTVPFSKMEQQPGWGDRAPHIAKDQLFAIQWQFATAGKEYDIAIDNVALVGCEQ